MVNIPILSLTHHHHKDISWLCIATLTHRVFNSPQFVLLGYGNSLWEVFLVGKFITLIEIKLFETEFNYLNLLLI